jgi:hypothetical protein
MTKPSLITESQPVFITHDTYKRECRYMRRIELSEQDMHTILESMDEDTRVYFSFHNVERSITAGTLLNGYDGFARAIYRYLKQQYAITLPDLINGQDFYVKIKEENPL